MREARIKFAKLRQLLLERGFRQVEFSDRAVGFQHDESDTLIVLPLYRANQVVLPHHLLSVRVQLDGRGLMEGDEFDELVASGSVQKSAS
jgi:hypothetical protein